MSGFNYLKLGSTLNNICNTTQLDDPTKCHYAFKNFWGEPCSERFQQNKARAFLSLAEGHSHSTRALSEPPSKRNQKPWMINPLPNHKILDVTKLKAFVDDKINVAQMMISVFDRVENIVNGKRRKCIFSFSHNVFYLSQTKFQFFCLSSANAFNLDQSKNL